MWSRSLVLLSSSPNSTQVQGHTRAITPASILNNIEMAPSKAAAAATAPYAKDERVLCFHHEMLYEAKILDVRPTEDNQSWQYKIHYKGWKNTVCFLDFARFERC
jgi:hypothetical protein